MQHIPSSKAGAFLHAIPTLPCIRMASSEMRVTLQRRLSLHVMSWGTLLSTEKASAHVTRMSCMLAWFSAIRAAHVIAAMKEPSAATHSAYST
eukprot:2779755-Pleurochrysis_carterae.AAC.1